MEEEFEDEDAMEAEEDEDLFGSAGSDAALNPSDRAAQRTEMVRQIVQTSRLYPRERKQEAPAIRKGTLRKVVQRSESAEELEGLKDVLRAWRVLGKNVTEMAANEIIGGSRRVRFLKKSCADNASSVLQSWTSGPRSRAG